MFPQVKSLQNQRLPVLLAVAAAAPGCSEPRATASQNDMTLGEAQAAFAPAFSVVTTVREMPDGRVLVADAIGQTLQLVDLDAGTADTLGSVGEGPDEYRQPDAVWPLPDGKTLLVDLGNARLTELSPGLEFGDTRPYILGEAGVGQELIMAIPQAVDAAGRLYMRSFGPLGGGMRSDSAYVLRFDPRAESLDTVVSYKLVDVSRRESGDANNRSVQMAPVPLSSADIWGVAADGRVVVARSPEYRLEWIAPDGTVTSGPAVPYDPVSLGQAEKEQWSHERGESGGGLSLSVSIQNTSMSMTMSRGGPGNDDDDLDAYDWPDVLPPFYEGRIPVDPYGRAWVRRHLGAGASSAYDLFDKTGERLASVEMSEGRRVVGFGAGTLYAVWMNDVGLQYLERYALPEG